MKYETAKMKTQLSQIETAAELLTLVGWQGVSTKQEDISRMQDIIGHSTIEELDRLANDKGTQSGFYHLLSVIWRWDDLIEFWNKHTNPDHKEMEEVKVELKRHKEWLKQKTDRVVDLNSQLEEAATVAVNAQSENRKLQQALHDKDREIMELKAKLYDLMVKENGAA